MLSKNRILWAVHNILAHPAMEVLLWVKLDKLGQRIHNITMPNTRGKN